MNITLKPELQRRIAETLFRKLVQEAPLRGPEWFAGLEATINSLCEMPERCPVV